MCPARRLGRGSGSSPRNRAGERASTTSWSPSLEAAATCVTSRTRAAWRCTVDVAVAQDGRDVFHRPSFGAPFREAAVEHRDLALAHQPEGPPDARGGEHAGTVVDDDLVAVADAHGAHPADEFLGRRGHVRHRAGGVGNLVDVEEARAGDMGGRVLRTGVAGRVSGRWKLASRTRRSGSPRWAASQSVETSVVGSSAGMGGSSRSFPWAYASRDVAARGAQVGRSGRRRMARVRASE